LHLRQFQPVGIEERRTLQRGGFVIQFGILGPLEVLVDGEPTALGGPRQRAVLARLLLDPARVVSAERLIDDVWDGRPPPSAAKTLQKYVSELRKALPRPVLLTCGGGYLLDVDDDRVDARRFERLLGDRQYAAALALWRGDVLCDLPDLTFADAERVRLDELRMFAIESRLEGDLSAGRHGSTIGELSELVEAHPLRERLTALLMLALYRAGRQVEALRVFDRHRRKLVDQVGVDPAVELRELEGAILRHDPGLELPAAPPVGTTQPPGNLPLTLTSFVGRASDLEAAATVVAENRLVTFTGPGGVGKTRLAVELGARIGGRFPGGVWMVDFAGVRQPHLVVDAVVSALSIDARHAADELEAMASALAHRPPSLLVLDNCEHLVAAVAAVAVAILRAGRDVRVLATSRRPLGVDGEFVRPVHPLPEDEAVRLFAERARLAGAGGPDISSGRAFEICRQLDGLPLAIELAASQLRVMDTAEIASRLEHQLTFRRPASSASPRQRTLGDMVQWSYNLLSADARTTFARLGVFASSLSLPAAEAVATHGETSPRDVLAHITSLVDHSLLVREPAPTPSSRYRLLETLRLFALERLTEAGAVNGARRAHAEYFLRLAEEGGPQMYGPDERSWRVRFEAEDANLQAALAWSAEKDPVLAMRLAIALWPYHEARWRERQAVAYLEALLSRHLDVPAELRAWALTAVAVMAGNPGETRRALPRAVEAVDAFRDLGHEYGLAEALAALAAASVSQGRLDEADAAVAEGLPIARRRHDNRLTGRLLDAAAFIARRRGDHARAAELSREDLAAWRAMGSRRGEATALRCLAVSVRQLGAEQEATELCHRAIDIWKDLGDQTAIAHVQTTLADMARMSGDLAGALQNYDAALVVLQAIGDKHCTASTYKNLATISAEQGQHRRADALYRDAVVLRYEFGDDAGLAELLEGLAGLNTVDGHDEHAATLIAAAAALRERTGSVSSAAEAKICGEILDTARQRLGAGSFDLSYQRGRLMSVAEVVKFALGERSSRQSR
jgi:predicted ATPase/DNA-binding SARP family transcriptional activator